MRIGRSLLLGLEVLVAADIVKTIAIELTFTSLGLLAGLVLVRTFLSWTLVLEMFSTSTVAIRTGIAPRWMAYLGFLLALALLIGSYFVGWSLAIKQRAEIIPPRPRQPTLSS